MINLSQTRAAVFCLALASFTGCKEDPPIKLDLPVGTTLALSPQNSTRALYLSSKSGSDLIKDGFNPSSCSFSITKSPWPYEEAPPTYQFILTDRSGNTVIAKHETTGVVIMSGVKDEDSYGYFNTDCYCYKFDANNTCTTSLFGEDAIRIYNALAALVD